jgi:hypothetical protein
MSEELGQIRLGTPFGNWMHDFCATNPQIRVVVEIGTWRGLGSTECIIRGMSCSNREDLVFLSLEADRDMHKLAQERWQGHLPPWCRLLHGRIVDIDEMDVSGFGADHPWAKIDHQALSSCSNIMHLVPDKIDFLFLDGGEFTTRAEYLKLKDRCLFVGMDDTTSKKCRLIREEVLSDPDTFEVLLDNPWYRNGVMVYRNKKAVS